MTTVSSTTASTTARTSYSTSLTDFDINSLVEEKVNERLVPADTIDAKVSANETTISAYQSMQSLLQSLQSAAATLSNATTGSFSQRSASLSSDTSTTASSILSATIASGTATGDHTVLVQQVAKAERIAGTSETSRTSALGYDGTLTLSEDGKTSADVTITSDMSLNDIRDAINGVSSDTGVTASVLTLSDGEYQLVLTAADTNKAIDVSSASSTNLAVSMGLTDSGGAYANELQAAQPAILSVDGVSGLQRDSNTIDDVIDGVTLNLTKADPSTTITLSVDNDTTSIETDVAAFVTAYNNWRDFVNTNQATNSDGTASSSATLFGDSSLRNASTAIDKVLGNLVNGASLGEYGFSLNGSHELTVDSGVLDDALTSNYSDIQKLFEYQPSVSNSNITLSSHATSTYSGSFALNITTDSSGAITGADVGGDSSLFTISGKTIKGVDGSAYAGLTFYYSGTTSISANISLSQGLADQMSQIADQYGNASTGTLASQISDLQSTDTTLAAKSADIRSQTTLYQNYLLTRYSQTQTSLSAASQTLDTLKALMDASSSSS